MHIACLIVRVRERVQIVNTHKLSNIINVEKVTNVIIQKCISP